MPETLLDELIAAARSAGLEVRLGPLALGDTRARSGLCRLRGRDLLLLDPHDSEPDRRQAILSALRQLDLENLYLSPAARKAIENAEL
jgi:hypothetical protein